MIRPISFREILEAPNADELLREYAAECSLPEIGPICPQEELYAAMERSGGFQAFGVFDAERLVGFAAVMTYVVPHYGRKIASTESIFLASAYRKKGLGMKLLSFVENYAKERGCVVFLYSAPQGGQFSRLLSVRDGYRHSNNVYLRSL